MSDAAIAAWGAAIDTHLAANIPIYVERGNEEWNFSYLGPGRANWEAAVAWGSAVTGVSVLGASPRTVTHDGTATITVGDLFVTGTSALNQTGRATVDAVNSATEFTVDADVDA